MGTEPGRDVARSELFVVHQHQARRYATAVPTEAFTYPFERGQVLAGKYRVEQLIGVGGVGFVVAARHLGLDSSVALKFLKPEFITNSEAVRSFTLESRVSFRIRNEHVVGVHDVDKLQNGIPFMVMELLKGQDMRRILQRHRYLSAELAADLALQSCEALAAAHALQIVHQDVKPENLFVTRVGDAAHVKMLDFGIARVAAATGAATGATSPLVAVGTPPYMSPEQIRASKDIDARTDQWSLGCVLYELLTGASPFARMTIMQSCAAVLEEEPPPLRTTRAEIPEELERVVLRCLRKDVGERFANVAELAVALAPFSKRFRYCSERCKMLLAKQTPRADTPPTRVPPPAPRLNTAQVRRAPTQAPIDRVPTATLQANTLHVLGPSRRRPTMNPLSTPVPSAAYRAAPVVAPPLTAAPSHTSSIVIAAASVSPNAWSQQADSVRDVHYVLGLKPMRARLVLVAVAVLMAVALMLWVGTRLPS